MHYRIISMVKKNSLTSTHQEIRGKAGVLLSKSTNKMKRKTVMKYVICNHINLTQRQKTNTGERLEEKKGTQKGTSRPINKTKKKTKGMKYKKKTTRKWKGTWTQTINKRLNPDHDPFFTTNNEYTKIKKEQTWKHNWLSVTHGTHGTQGRHSNKT